MKISWSIPLVLAGLLFAKTWDTAQRGYTYQFPRDHFSHPAYQTEWWYYTGNLRAPDGHRFGFELTFFRQASDLAADVAESEPPVWRPDQLYLAHLALSDIDGHSFYSTERLNRAGPGLAGASEKENRYWNGNWQVRWTAPGRSSEQQLEAVCDRFSLRLTLQPLKPPVIQGQNGISRKGPAAGEASHYISFTRIAARGRLEQKGVAAIAVNGLAWMDHEFFTEPASTDLSGWDWFAIQLDSGEELMIYELRNKAGRPTAYSSGSYIDRGGEAHFLPATAFTLQPGEQWQSRRTKARYPVSWSISVPSLSLTLEQRTDLPDQELVAKQADGPSYWEGAVSYRGSLRNRPVAGVGYLEMTGYGEPIKLSGMASK